MCSRGGDCDSCLFRSRCGGCSSCEAQLCSQACTSCSTLCPLRHGAHSLILSLGGPGCTLGAGGPVTLPAHIPVVPDRLREPAPLEYVGVHGGNFLARSGSRINKCYLSKGVAGALNLPESVRPILQFYIKDRPLEGFWDNRRAIYAGLADLRFHGILAPNYSLYDDAPRLEHLYNTKRSVTVYNEMLDAGLPAIPDVSWHSPEDLALWVREINRAATPVIGFSFQTVDVRLKASNLWRTILPGFRRLCHSIDPATRIILVGVSSLARIAAIHQEVPQQLHIINQCAFVQSRRGMLSEGRRQEPAMTMQELFRANIGYFDREYAALNHAKQRRSSIA